LRLFSLITQPYAMFQPGVGASPPEGKLAIPECVGGDIDHAMLQNISERKHASKQWLEAKAGIILPLHDHETLQSFSR
jgi:hypothetical protein